jgi:hypothetical protein
MRRTILAVIAITFLFFAGSGSTTARSAAPIHPQQTDQHCVSKCWDESVIFTLGCVAGGGSESYCSQQGYQYGWDCIVYSCVF